MVQVGSSPLGSITTQHITTDGTEFKFSFKATATISTSVHFMVTSLTVLLNSTAVLNSGIVVSILPGSLLSEVLCLLFPFEVFIVCFVLSAVSCAVSITVDSFVNTLPVFQ